MTSVSLVLQLWKLICLESMAHAHPYSSKESQDVKQSQTKLKRVYYTPQSSILLAFDSLALSKP